MRNRRGVQLSGMFGEEWWTDTGLEPVTTPYVRPSNGKSRGLTESSAAVLHHTQTRLDIGLAYVLDQRPACSQPSGCPVFRFWLRPG